MKYVLGVPAERFERLYVPEPNSGCWLWVGPLFKSGYGVFGIRCVSVRAHRWAYEHFNGPLVPGLDVRHSCDTRSCVNPEHLLLGTRQQNMDDAVRRNRVARGFAKPNTIIAEADIPKIIADPRPHSCVASEYGVCRTTIALIRAGKRRNKISS